MAARDDEAGEDRVDTEIGRSRPPLDAGQQQKRDDRRPDHPAKMPRALSAEQKRVLIQNGTYDADGTVNASTSKRLGWDKTTEARKRVTMAGSPSL